MNRITQKVPAITDFFTNSKLDEFKAFGVVETDLSVTRKTDGKVLTCDSPAHCRVIYDWNYTPVIQYVVP